MAFERKNLRHDVDNVVVGCNKFETNELVTHLSVHSLTQPVHLHTEVEVLVAPCHDMVVDHDDTCLIIFTQK